MNLKLIAKSAGNILQIEAVFMLLPLIVSLVYRSGDALVFVGSIGITVSVGTALSAIRPGDKNFRTKDAFAAAGVSWILLSLFGALPFMFSGFFDSIIDCLFESVSGFTTTGATILIDMETLTKGVMFWRCFTHWIGGMGVLMFMLAVMPSVNPSAVNLLRAESTGPTPDKIVPKIRETAKIMYLIYLSMTVLLAVLLYGVKLPLYDALITAFSTAGTGGFSALNASMGGYGNPAAEVLVTVFMFLFGISFTLHFVLIGGKLKRFFKDEELRLYAGVVVIAIAVITIDITRLYGGVAEALRYASFQVLSIISTAGFSTADYAIWPTLSQAVLVVLMVTGCCAGSTGGGIKLIRMLLLFKAARIEVLRLVHPTSVKAVSINDKKVNGETVSKTALFCFIYGVIFLVSVLLLSAEGGDVLTNTTAVLSALSNVGPGLGSVGPTGTFAVFGGFSKAVLSICMVAGRLELLPLLMLFTPSAWRR